jgi:hypothetical protein
MEITISRDRHHCDLGDISQHPQKLILACTPSRLTESAPLSLEIAYEFKTLLSPCPDGILANCGEPLADTD